MKVKDFIDEQIKDLSSIKESAQNHFGELTDGQLNWQPQPGKWSISQNLEHLNITGRAYINEIREAIKRGKNQDKRNNKFKHSWIGKRFINMMKPQSRFKMSTFKNIDPGYNFRGKESLDNFLELQDELNMFLNESYDLDLKTIKIRSPVFPVFKFRLGEAFEIVLTHEKRHLMQAQGVLKTIGFPSREESLETP